MHPQCPSMHWGYNLAGGIFCLFGLLGQRSMFHMQERRTQLFSATMTNKVAKLQRACLIDPVKVEVAQKYSTVDTLRQQYLFIPAKYKVAGMPSVVPKPSCFAVPPYPVTISMPLWGFGLHFGLHHACLCISTWAWRLGSKRSLLHSLSVVNHHDSLCHVTQLACETVLQSVTTCFLTQALPDQCPR